MSKKTWNKFTQQHNNPTTFTAAVSASLPIELQFDKNHQKLPTPYKLFQEWSEKALKDDWASTPIKKVGFAINVVSDKDVKSITDKFGLKGKKKQTPVGAKTFQIGYINSSYAELAKELGYELNS